MQSMRSDPEQDDDTLVTYGCASHWLNLLGQDLTSGALMKYVVDLQKYFCNYRQPGAW